MKKIVVHIFGKPKDPAIKELVNKYTSLCNYYIKTEVKIHKDPGERKISKSDFLTDGNWIILSESGGTYDSNAFSKFLRKNIEESQEIHFVIGNAFGFEQTILDKERILSLSGLTFTHELSLILLLEQIYRGFNIQSGGKYHK